MLSGWGLRQEAEQRGWPVSHGQFTDYRRWGLIPEPVEGRWPTETVDRLVRIRELGETVRSLARRVILLRSEFFASAAPLPADKVRDAFAATIPTIQAPKRKMKRLEEGIAYWGASQVWLSKSPRLAKGWRVPPVEDWAGILQAIDLSQPHVRTAFDQRVGAQYYFAMLLEPYLRGTRYDISTIPFEEQVALLIIRDQAVFQHHQREAAQREALEEQSQPTTGS